MNYANQELNFLKPDRVGMIVEFDAKVILKPKSGDIIMSYLRHFNLFASFHRYNQIIPSAFLPTLFSTLDSLNKKLQK